MFDIKKVIEEAKKEVGEEKAAKAKEKVKEKLQSLDRAQKIVANLERELEDLYLELGNN